MVIGSAKFIGDTESCFKDFVSKYPALSAIELLARFCCDGNVAMAQRWQRGEYLPGGEQLLRVRCFLDLAGYEVTEIQRLGGEVRKVAFLIGLGILNAKQVHVKLGYNTDKLDSLWRITLRGEGFSKEVSANLKELGSANNRRLNQELKDWHERIAAVIGQPPQAPANAGPSPDGFGSELATAFARSVTTTISLGRMAQSAGAKAYVKEATRGGLDLQELIDVLQKLI